MGNLLRLKIICPVRPLRKHEASIIEYTNNAIVELLSLSNKLEVTLLDQESCKVTISLLEDYKSLASGTKITSKAIAFQTDILDKSDSIDIEITEDYILTSEDRKSIFESVVSNEFRNNVYKFLILSQIAKPGSLKLDEGDVLVNNRLENFFYPFISILRSTLDQNIQFKWPEYIDIKYIDAWNWFLKNKFSLKGQSRTKTERAINAFTYLFKDNLNDMEFDLFWSLVGIEALYCSGKEGLAEQIFIKTQIVLGEITDFKKRLKQLYDFRSRLVHGDLDIPPKHSDFDDDDHIDFHQSLYDSANLAAAILTATLQRMVVDNKNDLNFKYVLQ